MIIHVVQEGETLSTIANNYNVLPERLILDNGISNPNNLAVGQTIVILYPLITYIIQEGDTLGGIAESYQVTVLQLLRNNPYLTERGYLIPGETIVITYETNKRGKLVTSGYIYPFIDEITLRTTLPFLTYLTVFNYQITREGELIDVEDSNILRLAKEYGVAPMMMVSTMNERGTRNEDISRLLISSEELQNKLIDNLIYTLKTKGYYGLNQYFQYLSIENQTKIESYVQRLSKRLHEEGLRFIVTVTPKVDAEGTEVRYENINYSRLAESTDGLLFLTFEWGRSVGPPAPTISNNIVEGILKNATVTVPPEKIFIGYPVTGYDWELPYIPGATAARSITSEYAVQLAADYGGVIQYNEIAKSSYFFYTDADGKPHIVWCEDARSIEATLAIVPEYGLQGISIWNTMAFFNQLWLIANVQYDIVKIEDIDIS